MQSALGWTATLREVIRDLGRASELWAQLTRRDIRLRYKQALLGAAWALLLPALLIGAGLILRIVAFREGGLAAPSLGGIAVKGWAWAYFAGAMNFATVSVLSNVQLVTKIYFPREVLPLASISAQCVDSAVGAGVLLCLAPWLKFTASLALLWTPLLLLLLVGLTVALGFFFASTNLFFRDVKYILQVLLTFGVFFTPVFFELASFGENGRLLLVLNPLTPIMEGLRLSLVDGISLSRTIPAADGGIPLWSPWYVAYLGAVVAITLPLSMVFFRRASTQFAEYY